MHIIIEAILVIFAYLLGSIPSAVWIGKLFYNIDVRQHGSGNAGATNTIRVLGWKAGIPVLIIDVVKGFIAVNLIRLTGYYSPRTIQFMNFQLLLGAAVVCGHIFPIFANFKGGKGVATMLGFVLAIFPIPTLIALGIFIIVLTITKYVSLSSIIAGISFPILVIFVFKISFPTLIIFSLLVTVLLILTHQKNIERLIRKEESKASFLMKRKD